MNRKSTRRLRRTMVAALKEELRRALVDRENARLEASHAWHVLGSHQHRYKVLLRAAQQLLTVGDTILPAEVQRLLDIIDKAQPLLIDEAQLKSAEDYIFEWWSLRHYAG